MICLGFQNKEVEEIVFKGFIRSFTSGQVILDTAEVSNHKTIWVGEEARNGFNKQIIFGKEPTLLNVKPFVLGNMNELKIQFQDHELTSNLNLNERYFERFDFTNEWNNLGYGRIENDHTSIWGLSSAESAIYCAVYDLPEQSILWFNRPVGPVDGFDWRMVEDFISNYRHQVTPTLPVLSEIPSGYEGAVTFRIDCDESISSGRALFELYQKHTFPFSLAIKTDQEINHDSLDLMQEVIRSNGSILIHSHTHAPDWGEPSAKPGPKSTGDAFYEASTSLRKLKDILPDYPISYAVSPFHQNPRAAIPKLVKAGIDGFIGGIICNDPEYLMARGGSVPFEANMVSHSEQCMFHGDCYRLESGSLKTYFDALDNAIKTETFFGYLDHPFSNYQYGWTDEEERIKAHSDFLKYLDLKPKIWKATSKDTLDFMWDRNNTQIFVKNDEIKVIQPKSKRSKQNTKIRFRNRIF